jgi:hypothetical protein
VTMNEIRPLEGGPEPQPSAGAETSSQGAHSASGSILSRLLSRRALVRTLALAAVAAVIAGAYILGSPAGSAITLSAQRLSMAESQGYAANGAVPFAAATAAPAPAAGGVDQTAKQLPATEPGQPNQLLAPLDSTFIVKTGQLSLEVTDLDKSVTQGRSAIAALGGTVSSSNRSGTGDYAAASVTYRVPAGRWDDALDALRKIGSKTLAEQTDASDVSSQVVDLEARLSNLKTTESALQAIMAKAVAIADVIAVESQLSQTQGQIEQLTAQRDHLKDQAAMSTLTVTFQLPAKTVTSQATQDWTLGSQVDEAAAALVRIGQGLATMGVWALVVVLPIGFGLLILLAFLTLVRRILGRGRNRSAATPA